MASNEQFGLKANPFHHLVTADNARIWVGMPQTKMVLGDVIRSAHPDDMGASEFVILAGNFGCGKTHAMRYFEHKIRDSKEGYPFYVSKSVRADKNHFAAVFLALIEQCDADFFSFLREKIAEALAKKEPQWGSLNDEAQSKALAEILKISGLDAEESAMAQEIAKNGGRKYIMDKGRDDSSAAVALASLIKVMTSSIGGMPAPYPAVYLFMDELEDIITQKASLYESFFRACRELINRIEGRFALVLGFSSETAVLDATLSPGLSARMTRPYIRTEDLDDKQAKEFVKEFLLKLRLPGFDVPQPFYPFTEEAVDFMLEKQPELLPRHIIMAMGRVFKRGREKLDGEKEFSKEIAEEVFREMGL